MKSKLPFTLVVVAMVLLSGCASTTKSVADRGDASEKKTPWYVKMFQASAIETAKSTPGSAR